MKYPPAQFGDSMAQSGHVLLLMFSPIWYNTIALLLEDLRKYSSKQAFKQGKEEEY